MRRELLLWVLPASLLAVALPRWVLRSQVPYNWDAASFTLAVDGIDLAQHRPHPPAAVGFVLAARLLRPLAAHDAHAALVLTNVGFAVASCLLLFALLYDPVSSKRAWLGWIVLVASVQHAFNTCVAEVYMSELAATLLVALLAWRATLGSAGALVAMGGALGLTGAFRLTGMVFLLPLAAYAMWRASVPARRKWLSVGAFAVCLAAWLVPLLWLTGAREYAELLWRQFSETSHSTNAVVSGQALRQLNRNLRDVAYSMVSGIGVWNVVALPLVALCTRPSRPEMRVLAFAAWWLVPGFAFFVGVHMGKQGYTLFLLPVLAATVAHVYAAVRRRAILVALVCGQLATGGAHFLWGRPASGRTIGEGRPYKEKSLAQKLATEARTIMSTTAQALREAEREEAQAQRAVASACAEPAAHLPVLVAADGDGLNWRRAMQAFPRHLTVRLPPEGATEAFVGYGGRFDVVKQLGALEGCGVVWLTPRGVAPGAEAGPVAGDDWPLVSRAPASVALTSRFRLVVRSGGEKS